ncbi:MAG: hypothetical protein WCB53_08170 [Terriglobales bacterium]
MKKMLIFAAVLLSCVMMGQLAWGQWSSNPAVNLPLADQLNSDQVQPKVRPLPNGQWYVSWFDADGNNPPPVGYDVYYQLLSAGGVEQFPHDGMMVANLTNSSTEDYGLDIDNWGNALLAFLDTREGTNQQVTAAKMDASGNPVWGPMGVQLTKGGTQHYDPKIAGTSDGGVVVAWTEGFGQTTNVKVQKLDPNGNPVWPRPVLFHEPGYQLFLSDMHAADNGSVIVSLVIEQGFFSNHQLLANKISATGKKLWGKNNVVIFDQGSLQFGNFPYFILDGSGGAVFSWYTSSPALQCFAQHIRADGSEAFPHNGSAGSTNMNDVRVDPSVSYQAKTDETFMFWTEEDSNQFYNGVSGQKFDGQGNSLWGSTGKVLIPLGTDTQTFVENVQMGTGALVMWVDSPGYGMSTMQAAKLAGNGKVTCAPFAVSSAPSDKYGLSVGTAPSGMAAVAWTDDRIGNNAIYIQNVNTDCSLGQE